MAKKYCGICGDELFLLTGYKIFDGYICFSCAEKSGLNIKASSKGYTVDHIKRTISHEIPVENHTTYASGTSKDDFELTINPVSGTWYDMDILHSVHKLENIVGYSYYEDDARYGVGRTLGHAAVGGLLFGGSGALVGAIIGNNQKRKIKKAGFIITENINGKDHDVNVLLRRNVKEGSSDYSRLMKAVKRISEEFDKVLSQKNLLSDTASSEKIENTPISRASEILELKKLMDDGIISQQEFEVGKANILKGN